jgi:hypothetical protein
MGDTENAGAAASLMGKLIDTDAIVGRCGVAGKRTSNYSDDGFLLLIADGHHADKCGTYLQLSIYKYMHRID